MQDLRSIPGGAPAHFFPAGGGDGLSSAEAAGSSAPCPASTFVDRRLRLSPQQNLKCPRCDSPNTKFCYFNNYNLSQPRHFCKSCRRYWTKGGVLRNVPVGGGCRKSSKRSATPTTTTSSKTSRANSSSAPSRSTGAGDNGSTLNLPPTTTTTSDAPPGAAEIGPPTTTSATRTSSLASTARYSFPDLHALQIPPPPDETQIMPDPDDHVLAAADGIDMPPVDLWFVDQAAPVELPPLPVGRSQSSDELAEIDWQRCLDTTVGLFDPAVGADQGLFWSHGQWGDVEPTPSFP